MSPIDTAVFQYTALGLLGLTLVVALIALLRIGGLKRALKERPRATAADVVPFTPPETSTSETPERREEVAEATEAAGAPGAGAEAEPAAATEEPVGGTEREATGEEPRSREQEPVAEAKRPEEPEPTQEPEPTEEPELVREGEVHAQEQPSSALQATPSEASGDGLAETPAAQAPESGETEAAPEWGETEAAPEWGETEAAPEVERREEAVAESSVEEEPRAEPRLVGASSASEGPGGAEAGEEALSTPSTVSAQQRQVESVEGAYRAETWDEIGEATPAEEPFGSEPEPAPAGAYAWARDMPEEQPIEREGRWWFKRGGELLLYDETTAQWVPAPVAEVPSNVPGESPRGGAEFGGAAAAETSSSFWKCPSCGAVNGSTASTCRMCFAARP
jgi:hypothetical protein